ncbi:MAG TPA: phage major capsid protein [Alphaproteobacteria bacterium]|nr:phage major capsid protein [Alphaproteobacteria bacterium]
MATPNSDFDDIITTTLRRRSKKLADNVSENTALLTRLKERGTARPFNGGRTIVEEIAFAGPGNFQWYSGYETLDVSQDDMLTAAEYSVKQAAVAISMSGLEMLQNAGPEQVIDLMAGRIQQGEREMINNISAGVYSDGTGSGGKQIGGLQLIVADDGTSTVGGIDSTTYTWWQNQVYDFSDESVTAGSDTIQTAMNTLYLNCTRNRDKPDLIVADNTYFRHYWESLQTIQRVTNDRMASAGFENLKFMGADVVFDGGQGGDAPAAHMYFLNTNYLHWRPHSQRNMVPLNPDRHAVNQDAVVKLVGFAGNMTCSNRALQGVIVA